MFESVRRHQKIFLAVILLLIIPSFVVVGAWDLISPAGDASTLAKVGRQKIQYAQWERAHQQAMDRIRQQLGGRINPAMLDSPAARLGTLNDLVTQQVLLASADAHRIRITDGQLSAAIGRIAQIQRNGKFDMALYQQALKAQGMTAEMFERQVRADLALEVLPNGIAASSIAPRSVARRLAQATHESRSFRLRRFSASDYASAVSVSAQEVQEFYQANAKQFQTAEEVDIAIVQLTKATGPEAAEQFANLVYEQSDTLEPAAKKFNLPIQTVTSVRRDGTPAKAPESLAKALANPRLITALFSTDAITNKRNTESIEIAPGHYASARVIRHRPSAAIALESVKPQIERQIRDRKAQEKATQEAQAFSSTAQQSPTGMGSARTLVRSSATKSDLPIEVLEAIFSAELKTLPHALSVPASARQSAAWAIVVESAKVPAGDSAEVKDSLGRLYQQMEQAGTADTLDRWLSVQRESVGVKVYPEKLTKSDSR